MKFTTSLLAFAGLAAAHMEMSDPAPFRSKSNPNAGQNIDYSMTAPLDASGANFPCKGYHVDLGTPAGKPTKEYTAGQSASMTIIGSAVHGGGSCQVSLSSDKGKTFKVIHSWIGDCPVAGSGTFPFNIPSDTPSGEYLLAWTWFNKIGNREMYMNCAAVTIKGASAKFKRAAAAVAFSARPDIFVANVGNGCSTLEGKDLDLPQPGPDADVTKKSTNTAPGVGKCQTGSGSGSVPPASGDNTPSTPASSQAPVASQPAASQPAASQPAVVSPPAASPPAASQPAATDPAAVPTSSLPGGVFVPVDSSTPSAPAATPVTPPATGGNTGSSGGYAAGTACTTEGNWNCIGGTSFQRCASGTWSPVQPVAPGTVCTAGESSSFIVAHAQ